MKDFKSNQNNTKGSTESKQDGGSMQDTKSPNIVKKPSPLKRPQTSGSSPSAPMAGGKAN